MKKRSKTQKIELTLIVMLIIVGGLMTIVLSYSIKSFVTNNIKGKL